MGKSEMKTKKGYDGGSLVFPDVLSVFSQERLSPCGGQFHPQLWVFLLHPLSITLPHKQTAVSDLLIKIFSKIQLNKEVTVRQPAIIKNTDISRQF